MVIGTASNIAHYRFSLYIMVECEYILYYSVLTPNIIINCPRFLSEARKDGLVAVRLVDCDDFEEIALSLNSHIEHII